MKLFPTLSVYQRYRLLEMIPAFFSWGTIIFCLVIALIKPYTAMFLIIIYDLYWLLRISYLSIYLVQSWSTFSRHSKMDWWSILTVSNPKTKKTWSEYYHLIFLPTYKEPLSVLLETFESLLATAYDHQKFIIVLAGEERDKENFYANVKVIQERYQNCFGQIYITLHPANIPGEIAGKGSNLHYAGHQIKKEITKLGLANDKIIVSTFDCDTQPSPQYFAYLTKTYIETPDRERCSYQPVPVYNNNIWQSSPMTRVVSSSTTFWLLTDLSRPERLLTFSSHSMSWQALLDVGFWQPDIVTEDTRIFLQCWLYYHGNYRTVPLFIPVSMSSVDVPNFWTTMINQYKQIRRWGWGVEHLPYLIWNLADNKHIPKFERWRYLWNVAEGMYSWATVPIIILILGYIPFWVSGSAGDDRFQATFLEQSTPLILSWLMRLSLIGLLLSAVFSFRLLPPRPESIPKWYWLTFVLQWIFVPVSLIIFGAVPALESQTRLALGKYLGFWVAPKKIGSEIK